MNLPLERVVGYWSAGGWLLFPIGLVSLGIWGYFLRSRARMMVVLREGAALLDQWHQAGKTGSQVGMADWLESRSGAVPMLLRLGLADVQHGASAAEAFAQREQTCLALLRRDFVVLSALTAIAPLLGLLGTVIGMVETFDAVSLLASRQGERVAAGISQALITTQFGLVVALPGVFGLARLHRMAQNAQAILAECRALALAFPGGAAEGVAR
ncbi:MAG: MotA/TolQ/ExbB proton channel family protein [Verrucomicrobiota bacterium]|nr:MotA/TolQ/ExbB proton channel family protein [Verrucomicrobiota bacterium]MDD8047513.1 MotA/TolQ/ExbB proton channel family protein [Verrucomicrobiota bacterium]